MTKSTNALGRAAEQGQGEDAAFVSKQPRRAFLAAGPAVDTSVLREELHKRGIASYALDEIDGQGRSLAELLDDGVRSADLVVVVLDGGKTQSVLIELGFALALKKRILALVPPEDELPVSPIAYLRTQPDNRDAIDFGLTQLLAGPAISRPMKHEPVPHTRPLGRLADELLQKIQEASSHPHEQVPAEIVQEALTGTGITVSSRSAVREGTLFAIWSDDFEPWIGNPLLIEVRSRLTSEADLETALAALTGQLENTHTAWGLLLFDGAQFDPKVEWPDHPRVFVLSLVGFLEFLRETSLGDWLREMRKRRVHGRR